MSVQKRKKIINWPASALLGFGVPMYLITNALPVLGPFLLLLEFLASIVLELMGYHPRVGPVPLWVVFAGGILLVLILLGGPPIVTALFASMCLIMGAIVLRARTRFREARSALEQARGALGSLPLPEATALLHRAMLIPTGKWFEQEVCEHNQAVVDLARKHLAGQLSGEEKKKLRELEKALQWGAASEDGTTLEQEDRAFAEAFRQGRVPAALAGSAASKPLQASSAGSTSAM